MRFVPKKWVCCWPSILLSVLAIQTAAAGNFTNFTLLRSFLTNDLSANPFAPLTETSDGMLYGTTYGGHGSDVGGVFRIGKDGNNFGVIHKFTSAEGDQPSAAVIEATNGVLYGTTYQDGPDGGGSIFKINKDGSGFAVLHNFNYRSEERRVGKECRSR